MRRTLCTELPARAGHTVRLAGWVHRRRQLGAVSFLVLRDRSGTAQVVATGAAREAVASLTEETPVEVVGLAVANPAAPGGVEVTDPVLRALSEIAEPPPVTLYRPEPSGSLPVRLDHAPVALRHPRRAAVARIAAAAVAGMRSTLDAAGFTEVFTPRLVATATESGANVFAVDYFGRVAYLAQSPQFAKQTLVGALERVYEVGPVFRAEPHDTARHLAEYTSLDVELGFVTDHTDVMAVARDVVAGMLAAVARRAAAEVALLQVRVPEVPAEVPALPFRQAQRMVGEALGEDLSGEPDLAPAHERWLGGWARAEHGSDLLFVTGYPMAKRPIYTHPDPADPAHSRSFDLIWRGMELATGGQRLHRYADHLAALSGVDLAPYQGYLAAFRHGMPPHGGFAFGLERFVSRLVGAANVREVALFPRDAHRLAP
jgi:nondiscriminating aspartyl-tRNA synthetase